MAEQNPNGQKCGTCFFWFSELNGNKYCRKGPPTPFFIPGAGMTGPSTISAFPPIAETGWCGEWKPDLAPAGQKTN